MQIFIFISLHWKKPYLIFHIYGLKMRQIFLISLDTHRLLCIAQPPLQVPWTHVTSHVTGQWDWSTEARSQPSLNNHSVPWSKAVARRRSAWPTVVSGKWEANFHYVKPLRPGGYLLLQHSVSPWLVHPAFRVKARSSRIPYSVQDVLREKVCCPEALKATFISLISYITPYCIYM